MGWFALIFLALGMILANRNARIWSGLAFFSFGMCDGLELVLSLLLHPFVNSAM